MFNNLPKILIILVCISNSVATKKGNKEGTTEVAHNCKPDFIAGRLLPEKINKQAVKAKKINAKKFRLTLKTKKLQECIKLLLLWFGQFGDRFGLTTFGHFWDGTLIYNLKN